MTSADDAANAGTFLVSSGDETAVVLQNVSTAQVFTVPASDLEAAIAEVPVPAPAIDESEGVKEGSILEETTVSPASDGVRWTVDAVGTVRWVPIERVDLEPTKRSRETAAAAGVGTLTTQERAGEGAVHVLGVPPDDVDSAAGDVRTDPATRRRAARQAVDRVEIRTGSTERETEPGNDADASGAVGVVSVRYLPN